MKTSLCFQALMVTTWLIKAWHILVLQYYSEIPSFDLDCIMWLHVCLSDCINNYHKGWATCWDSSSDSLKPTWVVLFRRLLGTPGFCAQGCSCRCSTQSTPALSLQTLNTHKHIHTCRFTSTGLYTKSLSIQLSKLWFKQVQLNQMKKVHPTQVIQRSATECCIFIILKKW